MSLFNQVSNDARRRIALGQMIFISHSFKMALMKEGFEFNPQTAIKYEDIAAAEHPEVNGYLIGGNALNLAEIQANYLTGACNVSWHPVQWTANGGAIGPTGGGVIYNNTIADKPILGFVAFGQILTQADRGNLIVTGASLVIN
jgi:hypothetical protein